MASSWRDFRSGFRLLREKPAFTAAAVISLALGIGANTAVFSLVDAAFLYSTPVKDPWRAVSIFSTQQGGTPAAVNSRYLPVSYPNYLDLRSQSQVFEDVAAFAFLPVSLTEGGQPERVLGEIVSGNYFSVLGIGVTSGHLFRPQESLPGAPPVAVLSHWLWQRRFGGDPGVVGRKLLLNGHPFEIIGVAERGFKGTRTLGETGVWMPLVQHPLVFAYSRQVDDRLTRIFECVGRLRPGRSAEQAEEEMRLVGRRLQEAYPDANRDRGLTVLPLPLTALDPARREMYYRAAAALVAVAGAVLLIACANVANLLLLQATARRREVAIRLAMGAGRGQLVRQLLTENLPLALMGGGAALAVGAVSLKLIWINRPPFLNDFQLDIGMKWDTLAFTALLSLATLFLFGLAPALAATRRDLVPALTQPAASAAPRGRRPGLGGLLIIIQVSLSSLALVGSGLFLKSLGNARGIDPGFERKNLMLMAVSPEGQGYDRASTLDFYRRAVSRVQEITGVRAATLASNLPLTPLGIRRTTMVEGREEGALIRINIVLPGYLETVGIPLRHGRDFRPQDEESAPLVAIVNETMAARLWPGEAAVGRRFHWNRQEDRPLEVVGVAADSKYITMGEEPEPHIYLPLAQAFSGTMVLLVRTDGDPESLMAPIRRAVQGLDPRMPLVGVATISSVIDESLWASHLGAALLLGFGLLALTLAGTGVYGMMSYSSAQRTHEIGIRSALGARPRNVVAMILRDGLWLVATGVAAGLLVAVWGARLVAGLLYGVDPLDPTVYLSAGAVLVGVALWACYLPARHATRVDPVVALRSE